MMKSLRKRDGRIASRFPETNENRLKSKEQKENFW